MAGSNGISQHVKWIVYVSSVRVSPYPYTTPTRQGGEGNLIAGINYAQN